LQGETGVGKEVFARSLHEMSARSGKPFVAVNCAAIPHELVESELFGVEKGAYTGALVSRPGRFERADGGTLFLDEIGDLPASAQAKLLRVLQEGEIERLGDQKTRKINVRWWRPPTPTCRNWSRRALPLRPVLPAQRLPDRHSALRERKQDIPLLAKHFLAKHTAIHGKKLRGFTDKAKRALLAYAWPGNIRELQNAVERGVILAPSGTRIEVSHLFMSCSDEQPPEFGLDNGGGLDVNCWETGKDLREAVFNGALTLDQVEAMLLETAVDKARGNLSSAARMLGITRPQIAYRLKRLQEGTEATLRPSAFRQDANRVRLMPAQLPTRLPPQVAAYLAGHHVMTLATQGGEGPWAAAVFYASDGASLIFLSAPNTRHAETWRWTHAVPPPSRKTIGSGRRSRASSSKAVSSNCRATRKNAPCGSTARSSPSSVRWQASRPPSSRPWPGCAGSG
jgi:hypothetical protein